MNGLPLIPKYVRNPANPQLDPATIDQSQAIQRGTYLFSKIDSWLKNDGSYRSAIPGMNPPAGWSMPEDMRAIVVSYFDTPERKEWLGRQFYAMQGGIVDLDEGSPINMDDIPLFFNWLFRVPDPSYKIPANEESPLTFLDNELQVQEGGQRRRRRKRQPSRKGRAASRRSRRSQRK